METNRDEKWVAERLAALAPAWQPDIRRGRGLLADRLIEKRRRWTWTTAGAVAAAACVAMMLSVPEARALAQEWWYTLTVHRIEVVRLDLSDLPLQANVSANGSIEVVPDIDQAEQKAGYRPFLPPSGVLSAEPKLRVIGPMTVEQTIRVRELQTVLAKVGVHEVVPPDWEGRTFRTQISSMVAANYSEDLEILQALPFELSVPQGVDLKHLMELTFRGLGVARWEARLMAQKFAANPAWLMDIPEDEVAAVQELELRVGPALLIEDFYESGGLERATVIRSTRERIYVVSSPSRELSVRVTEALR